MHVVEGRRLSHGADAADRGIIGQPGEDLRDEPRPESGGDRHDQDDRSDNAGTDASIGSSGNAETFEK